MVCLILLPTVFCLPTQYLSGLRRHPLPKQRHPRSGPASRSNARPPGIRQANDISVISFNIVCRPVPILNIPAATVIKRSIFK